MKLFTISCNGLWKFSGISKMWWMTCVLPVTCYRLDSHGAPNSVHPALTLYYSLPLGNKGNKGTEGYHSMNIDEICYPSRYLSHPIE
jgi:hypothetical protein